MHKDIYMLDTNCVLKSRSKSKKNCFFFGGWENKFIISMQIQKLTEWKIFENFWKLVEVVL